MVHLYYIYYKYSQNAMNTITLRKRIKMELEELNSRIDAKIVRGRSYARDARRHKELLTQFYNLNRPVSTGWFSHISTFLF